MNARNRSMKSGFMGRLAAQFPELLAQTPDLQDAFGLGQLHPVLDVVAVGLGSGRVPTHRHTAGSLGCHGSNELSLESRATTKRGRSYGASHPVSSAGRMFARSASACSAIKGRGQACRLKFRGLALPRALR